MGCTHVSKIPEGINSEIAYVAHDEGSDQLCTESQGLLALPADVLYNVVQKLARRDVAALRRVCRSLASACSLGVQDLTVRRAPKLSGLVGMFPNLINLELQYDPKLINRELQNGGTPDSLAMLGKLQRLTSLMLIDWGRNYCIGPLDYNTVASLPKGLCSLEFKHCQFEEDEPERAGGNPVLLPALTRLVMEEKDALFGGEDGTDLPAWLTHLPALAELKIVSHILRFPRSLVLPASLVVLDVDSLAARCLPDKFSASLPQLEVLRIDALQLERLPADIGRLGSRLRELQFVNSGMLNALPDSLSQLTGLTALKFAELDSLYIDTRFDPLRMLPESMTRMARLQSLVLHLGRLQELPAGIGALTGLETLDLESQEIRALPSSFGQLTSLRSIKLISRNLQQFPEGLGCLTRLTRLDANCAVLSGLPASTSGLRGCLLELRLVNGTMEAIPEVLGRLTALRELEIYSSAARTLPESFGDMVGMREVKLNMYHLTALPNSIGPSLSSLETLRLQWCSGVRELPPGIGHLPALTRLDVLDCMALTTLPEDMSGLTKLRQLSMTNCDVSQMPASLSGLSCLERVIAQKCAKLSSEELQRRLPPRVEVICDTSEVERSRTRWIEILTLESIHDTRAQFTEVEDEVD